MTHFSIKPLAQAVGLAVALAACNGTADQQPPVSAAPVAQVSEVSDETSTMNKMSKKDQVAWSVNDLARRMKLASSEVRVAGATDVQWRSGAIGCPEPGMNYTQALVDGLWIMLWVETTPYRYHAVVGGQPFYCPNERAETPVMGSGAD